ncbi:hypothetical protein O9929_23305 [Vibrio lentus]|nr:hypothetical protein [Vibrio lentus]
MVPIGRNNVNFIIGDRQTGKTALKHRWIINQKDSASNVFTWLLAKASTIVNVVSTEDHDVKNTTGKL